MPRLIVTGNNGLVSGRLYSQRCQLPIETCFLSRTQSDAPFGCFDLNNPDAFDYDNISHNDIVVLLAGVSQPDECEKKYLESLAINVSGTITLAEKMIQRGAKILFASSDIVYGETTGVVGENTPCRPVGNYGIMKHNVEQHFQRNPSFKSMRLSLVYSQHDKFTKYLSHCARNHLQAEIFHPILRNVVYIQDVIDAVVTLAIKWESVSAPVINMGGPELLSRVDLAEMHTRLVWPELPYRSTYPGDSFFEVRPKTIAMNSHLLESILERPLHTIEQAIVKEFREQ